MDLPYKIIFCDIDGTLIKGWSKIGKKNLQAIIEYIDLGGLFVLSTGRSIASIQRYIKQIGSNKVSYAICSSGGYIYNFKNDTSTSFPINNELSWKILEEVKREKGIWFWGYNEESNKKEAVYSNDNKLSAITKLFKSINTLKIKPNTNLTCYKIVLVSLYPKKINKIYQYLTNNYHHELSVTYQNKRMLEINAYGISKGSAIKKILFDTKITPDQAIAIGNGHNDIQAFKSVAKGISINTKDKHVKYSANISYHEFNNMIYKIIKTHAISSSSKNK